MSAPGAAKRYAVIIHRVLMEQPMNRPVIVCGLGRVGRRVLDYLRAAQIPAVVVDTRLDPATLPPGVRGVCGDCRQPSVLQQAGIADARGVLVLTSDDLANVSA